MWSAPLGQEADSQLSGAVPLSNALKQRWHAASKAGRDTPEENHDPAAMVHGAKAINKTARKVLAEVKKHAADPDSKFHRDALALAFNRICPLKSYSSEAVRLARLGAFDDDSIDCAKPLRKRTPR